MFTLIIRSALGLTLCSAVFAQCQLADTDQVFCAKNPQGGAVLTPLGKVHCGVGECLLDDLGKSHCASISGGGAARDSLGRVRCQGGCEPGSEDFCVIAQP